MCLRDTARQKKKKREVESANSSFLEELWLLSFKDLLKNCWNWQIGYIRLSPYFFVLNRTSFAGLLNTVHQRIAIKKTNNMEIVKTPIGVCNRSQFFQKKQRGLKFLAPTPQ